MSPVHTSPPSCNGYLAFAGVQIQLTALTYQLQELASTGSECLLRAQVCSLALPGARDRLAAATEFAFCVCVCVCVCVRVCVWVMCVACVCVYAVF